MFHFHGTSHAFQYTTIKMTIFCACKNLLIKKVKRILKSLWRPQKSFFLKETLLKVDLENKMIAQSWFLWWFSKFWTTEEACYRWYFEKEKALNLKHLPLQEKHVAITIVKWLVSTWRIYLTEGKEERRLRLSNYFNEI